MEVYYFNESTGESQWDPPVIVESTDALQVRRDIPFLDVYLRYLDIDASFVHSRESTIHPLLRIPYHEY